MIKPSRESLSRHWKAVYWGTAIAVMGVWAVVALRLMPAAITSAHAGEGVWILRRAMAQASARPLAGYLEKWDRLAVVTTFFLTTGILILYVVLSYVIAMRTPPGARRSGEDRGLFGEVAASGGVGPWAPLVVALWFGLLGGLGESYYCIAKVYLLAESVPQFAPTNLELAVLGPWVNAALFGMMALPLGLVVRRPARGLVLVLVTFAVCCFLVVLGWIRLPERVGLIPAMILAAGITAQAMRSLKPRLARFISYSRKSLAVGAGLLVIPVVLVNAARLQPDWRTDVEPETGSPNVLLVVLDTERASDMGLYGHDGDTTPRLDAFAVRGVTFTAAYSSASWTLPAHAGLFTGRYPIDIGMMRQKPLPGRYATLAEAFEEAGYATGGFVGNLFFLTENFRLNRGFRTWRTAPIRVQSLASTMWLCRSVRQRVRQWQGKHRYLVLKDARTVNRQLLAWLDRVPEDRPFFAFLNYFDVHEPYTSAPPPDPSGRNRNRTEFLEKGKDAGGYTADRRQALREAYDRSIRYLDGRVGEMLDALQRRGRLDNTIVVITADHGEQFGLHGFMDHGNSLYRQITHVPLIVMTPAGSRGRVEYSVGIDRIAATLADLAGLAVEMPGHSLRADLTGQGVAEPTFSFLRQDVVAVSDGPHRLIRSRAGDDELYDVRADPRELNDLSDDPAASEVLNHLLGLIEAREPQ